MNGLSLERDLTLVFEREDVKEALVGHCAVSHSMDDVRKCEYCMRLIVIVADAVCAWRDICALEAAATHSDSKGTATRKDAVPDAMERGCPEPPSNPDTCHGTGEDLWRHINGEGE
jgi:hypothetical protein